MLIFQNDGHMKKIVIVLGMHRSGTSLLTSVLHELGFNPGKELLDADPSNQEGFWEFKPLVQFHSRILEDYDNRWFAPGHHMPLDELLFQYRDEAESLIRRMDNDDKDWCWKDPRLVLFLDFWLEILSNRDVKWIITHRNPVSIASSLKSRDHFDMNVGLTLWEYYVLLLMARKQELKENITIQYEEMLSDPKTQIDRIASFLQPQWDEKTRLSHYESAINRIKVEAAHHRDPSALILSEQQQCLEKWLLDEKEPPGNIQTTLMIQVHRRFFRKLFRESQGMTIKNRNTYESLLAAERQKTEELYQIINSKQEQLDQHIASSPSNLIDRNCSLFRKMMRSLKGEWRSLDPKSHEN